MRIEHLWVAGLFTLLSAPVFPALAQMPEGVGQAAQEVGTFGNRVGFHLYGASFSGGYSSNALPDTAVSPRFANLGGVFLYTGNLSMGWVRSGERSNISVLYTPGYTAQTGTSGANASSQNLNINVSHQLAQRWILSVSASGMTRTLQQALFSPLSLSNLAAAPSTIASLGAAMVTGNNANPQLSSLLNGPPVAVSPASTILYGDRYLTAGLSTSIAYVPSERLKIQFGVNGMRSQGLPHSTVNGVVTPIRAKTTGMATQFQLSYQFTPRLTLSANQNSHLTLSGRNVNTSYGNSFIHDAGGSLGYLAGAKWLFTVGGGVGYIDSSKRTTATGSSQTPSGFRYLANGSIAYKLQTHTIIARANRTASDTFGIGASTSFLGGVAWNWTSPGRGWAATADASYQSFQTSASSNLSSWRGLMAVHRVLSSRLSSSLAYTVFQNSGIFSNTNYALTRSAVRLTLNWSFTDNGGRPGNDTNF